MIGLNTRVSSSGVVVTARYPLRPESAGRMRVIVRDLTIASGAEDGCILYFFAESTDKASLFTLLMIWRDESSYERYAGSDYVRAFNSILSGGMLAGQPSVEKWRPLA